MAPQHRTIAVVYHGDLGITDAGERPAVPPLFISLCLVPIPVLFEYYMVFALLFPLFEKSIFLNTTA